MIVDTDILIVQLLLQRLTTQLWEKAQREECSKCDNPCPYVQQQMQEVILEALAENSRWN